MLRKLITTLIILIFSFHSMYAESGAVDFLNSTGKIYSVIAVILVILLGLAFILIRLERKISKLEKQINNEH